MFQSYVLPVASVFHKSYFFQNVKKKTNVIEPWSRGWCTEAVWWAQTSSWWNLCTSCTLSPEFRWTCWEFGRLALVEWYFPACRPERVVAVASHTSSSWRAFLPLSLWRKKRWRRLLEGECEVSAARVLPGLHEALDIQTQNFYVCVDTQIQCVLRET